MSQGYAADPITSRTIKWAAINATIVGDTTVVAAVVGKKIRVIACYYTCAGSNQIAWKTGSTVLVEAMTFAGGGGMSPALPEDGYVFETAAGEALVVNLGSSNNVRGAVIYQEV